MNSLMTREDAERALCRARLYKPARDTYQRLLNREYFQWRLDARDFFADFIEPGDLVIDVGANQGRMSEVFLELGARVIAVEPNPRLGDLIGRRYRRLQVEVCAVGEEPGHAELHIGADPGHSTVSSDWAQTHEERWIARVTVPVVTLDQLIDRHGDPAFVKIDVEGFELHVLSGLSQRVRRLCFEFQCAALPVATACVERLDGYEFALAHGEGLSLTDWMTGDEAIAELQTLRDGDPSAYGDVHARRR